MIGLGSDNKCITHGSTSDSRKNGLAPLNDIYWSICEILQEIFLIHDHNLCGLTVGNAVNVKAFQLSQRNHIISLPIFAGKSRHYFKAWPLSYNLLVSWRWQVSPWFVMAMMVMSHGWVRGGIISASLAILSQVNHKWDLWEIMPSVLLVCYNYGYMIKSWIDSDTSLW